VRWWYGLSTCPLGDLAAAARLAEALGFEGVTLPYVLIQPEVTHSPYPYAPDGRAAWDPTVAFADPLVAVGALAAVTDRLRFCTNVHTAPVQDPFTLAKAVGTAAVLSGGRLVFGVGSGWLEEAFVATGQPFADRGRRLDEMVVVLRKLFTGEVVEHHGEFYDFDRLRMSPGVAPVPIYGGGHSERALDRAARLDGWLGVVYDLDEAKRLAAALRARRRALGAPDDDDFGVVLSLRDDPPPHDVRDLEALGVTDLWKLPSSFGDPARRGWDERRAEMERFADRCLSPAD
jgi:probable F420-dependent oxidoreductase